LLGQVDADSRATMTAELESLPHTPTPLISRDVSLMPVLRHVVTLNDGRIGFYVSVIDSVEGAQWEREYPSVGLTFCTLVPNVGGYLLDGCTSMDEPTATVHGEGADRGTAMPSGTPFEATDVSNPDLRVNLRPSPGLDNEPIAILNPGRLLRYLNEKQSDPSGVWWYRFRT